MTNESTTLALRTGSEPLNPEIIKGQRDHVALLMQSLMIEGTHYGRIPGTPANAPKALLKAGAETLLQAFHIGVKPHVEDIGRYPEIAYRVTCDGIHLPTGELIGSGVGEASTREEKFAWRAVVCPEEYNSANPSIVRIKYKQDYDTRKIKEIQQIRQDPQGLGNTIVRYAKKRAMVDMTITALNISDMFARRGPEKPNQEYSKNNNTRPAGGKIDQSQIKFLGSKLHAKNIDFSAFFQKFNIHNMGDLDKSQINDALEWIQKQN